MWTSLLLEWTCFRWWPWFWLGWWKGWPTLPQWQWHLCIFNHQRQCSRWKAKVSWKSNQQGKWLMLASFRGFT